MRTRDKNRVKPSQQLLVRQASHSMFGLTVRIEYVYPSDLYDVEKSSPWFDVIDSKGVRHREVTHRHFTEIVPASGFKYSRSFSEASR